MSIELIHITLHIVDLSRRLFWNSDLTGVHKAGIQDHTFKSPFELSDRAMWAMMPHSQSGNMFGFPTLALLINVHSMRGGLLEIK